MFRITRLKLWCVCVPLIGLAYASPLQMRAAVISGSHPASLNHTECSAPSSHPDSDPAVTTSASACEVALSGPLLAPRTSDQQTQASVAPASSAAATAYTATPVEDMVYQVNQLRVSKGLSPVKSNDVLAVAANDFAIRMGGSNFFSHNDPDNGCNKPWDRMTAAGYTNWNLAAENIAAGYNTAAAAMDGFINSPSHYNTLVNPKLREVGVGLFRDETDGNNVRLISSCPNFTNTSGPFVFYWVQDFGSRYSNGMPVLPVIINNEAPVADGQIVTLYVYGGENGQPQWVTQMRFSFDGSNWSAYEPYAAQKTLGLPRGTGMKTVYAQLMNAAGAVQTVSDSIFLDDPMFTAQMPFHAYMPLTVK